VPLKGSNHTGFLFASIELKYQENPDKAKGNLVDE